MMTGLMHPARAPRLLRTVRLTRYLVQLELLDERVRGEAYLDLVHAA